MKPPAHSHSHLVLAVLDSSCLGLPQSIQSHVFAESAVLANDLREEGFTVVSLDTGWVRTETGNTTEQHTNGNAPLDVLTSVAGKAPCLCLLPGL